MNTPKRHFKINLPLRNRQEELEIFSFHAAQNFPNNNIIFIFSDVTEHKIVILEKMRLDVNVRLTNLNATLEEGVSCPARFAMAILTAQTVLMNGIVL